MNNQNSDDALIVGGLLALTVVTAPIWLPALIGIKPKHCECGAKIEPSGIIPGCKCYY